MRNIMIGAILLISMSLFGQEKETIWEAYGKYVVYCNQLVFDTLIEYGTITFDYVEVDNGLYALKPIDTVWKTKSCPEYKYSNHLIYGINWDTNYIIDTRVSDNSYWSEKTLPPEPAKKTQSITRKKVYKVKLQEDTWDDFWNKWSVENGYR